MASPPTLVFDLATPRRPGLDDVGGGAKQNDLRYPPDPKTQVTAEDVNQWSALLQRLAGIVPAALLNVSSAGVLTSVVALPTGANVSGGLTAAFTVARTGTGLYAVSWPSSLLPAAVSAPRATPIWDGSSGSTVRGAQCALASATSVNVQTFNVVNGALVDCAFSLAIY